MISIEEDPLLHSTGHTDNILFFQSFQVFWVLFLRRMDDVTYRLGSRKTKEGNEKQVQVSTQKKKPFYFFLFGLASDSSESTTPVHCCNPHLPFPYWMIFSHCTTIVGVQYFAIPLVANQKKEKKPLQLRRSGMIHLAKINKSVKLWKQRAWACLSNPLLCDDLHTFKKKQTRPIWEDRGKSRRGGITKI